MHYVVKIRNIDVLDLVYFSNVTHMITPFDIFLLNLYTHFSMPYYTSHYISLMFYGY
jgi:hypothetical protein